MTENDAAILAKKVVDELTTRKRAQWVDPETHFEHHRHVATLMQREADMSELKKKIIYSACLWALPLLLMWVASSFWQSIVRAIHGAMR